MDNRFLCARSYFCSYEERAVLTRYEWPSIMEKKKNDSDCACFIKQCSFASLWVTRSLGSPWAARPGLRTGRLRVWAHWAGLE